MIAKQFSLILACFLAGYGAWAADDSSTLEQLFIEAKSAYDAEDIDTAIERYERILAGGHHATALYYNLANAHFRKGEIGRAILNYRKAQLLSPGDPDVQANLNFAIKQTDAETPPIPTLRRLVMVLPQSAWALLAVGGYWLAALLLIAWSFNRRPGLLKAGILLAVAAGLAASLWWMHSLLNQQREVVVLEKKSKVRHAPIDTSQVHYTLPEGSIALLEGEEGDWLKVRSGQQQGYILREACGIVELRLLSSEKAVPGHRTP